MLYRDKETREQGEIVQIMLVPGSSKNVAANGSFAVTDYVRSHDLPAINSKSDVLPAPFLQAGAGAGTSCSLPAIG
jgi:hypothetical protein